MNWNEANKTLTIHDRKGDFTGMLKDRTFRIVKVNATNGTGVKPALKAEQVSYTGQEINIRIR